MEFIKRINQSFNDFEQERYLLERSMEISSKEMLDLNQRFENAQSVAHIGYWFYNRIENKTLWSRETYRLFGLDPTYPVPSFKKIMQMVHEKDRRHLEQLIDRAFTKGEDYEMEFRITHAVNNKEYWMYIKGNTYKKIPNQADSEYLISGIVMDITERKIYEKSVQELNEKLISIARRAGMSEIATSVLHNIGNVLNSVNISVAMIQESLNADATQNLVKVSQMISDNLSKEPDYLVKNEKGKLIPEYLINLSNNISVEREKMISETTNLITNIQHIKDIVHMQKDISGLSGINEKVFLPELMDLAIQISSTSPEKDGIKIIKNYTYDSYIIIDRSRILQILVNLIQNAKESLLTLINKQKIMTLSIQKKSNEPYIELIVQDNGIGIARTNSTKIFTMGFTTKPTGHGFGLHSCALVAIELGGSLVVESKGVGNGARFILKIPLNTEHSFPNLFNDNKKGVAK